MYFLSLVIDSKIAVKTLVSLNLILSSGLSPSGKNRVVSCWMRNPSRESLLSLLSIRVKPFWVFASKGPLIE